MSSAPDQTPADDHESAAAALPTPARGDDYILVPRSWRFILSLTRVALAVACVLADVLSGEPTGLLTRLVLILFLLFAVVAATWRILERVRYALFALILDSVFFLICASLQTEWMPYLASVLYLYLISSTLLIHPWRSVATVAAVIPLLFVLVRPDAISPMLPILFLVGGVGLVAARNRQLLIGRLIETSRKAVIYRGEALSARDQERERIAADFHDGPQQSFISLQMRLEVLRRILEKDPEKAQAELADLQETTRKQVAEVRSFVRAMQPAAVDVATLAISVSRLIDYFEKESGISTRYEADALIDVGDQKVATEILQIVREAMHNAQKHSGASLVTITLERSEGGLELRVKDNGSGFPFDGKYSLEELDVLQAGPVSIKRRVRALDGSLIVESHPEEGALLTIRIPV